MTTLIEPEPQPATSSAESSRRQTDLFTWAENMKGESSHETSPKKARAKAARPDPPVQSSADEVAADGERERPDTAKSASINGTSLDGLKGELVHLAAPRKLKLRLDRYADIGVRIDERDKEVTITINPSHYRSKAKWDSMVDWLREQVA